MEPHSLFPIFESHPDLVTAISTTRDGTCSVAPESAKAQEEADTHRKAFLGRLGIAPERVVSAGLVHGVAVHRAMKEDAGKITPDTDALFAVKDRDLFLSITVADCFPVFFFDPESGTFGIAHAGWRGIAHGIIHDIVADMAAKGGAAPERLQVGIGPGIGVCHFEVKNDVTAKFAAHPRAIVTHADHNGDIKTFVDLPQVIREQLSTLGVKPHNVNTSPVCTYDDSAEYFSYRRDHPKTKEVMMAVIGLAQQ